VSTLRFLLAQRGSPDGLGLSQEKPTAVSSSSPRTMMTRLPLFIRFWNLTVHRCAGRCITSMNMAGDRILSTSGLSEMLSVSGYARILRRMSPTAFLPVTRQPLYLLQERWFLMNVQDSAVGFGVLVGHGDWSLTVVTSRRLQSPRQLPQLQTLAATRPAC
jgi:hypothetical protein